MFNYRVSNIIRMFELPNSIPLEIQRIILSYSHHLRFGQTSVCWFSYV